MVKHLLKLTLLLLITIRLTGIGACTQTARARLDPADPTTIMIWHYYNGNQLVNFDQLVNTFNETAGMDEGIRVTAVSQGNDRDLAAAVKTAAASKAVDLPDIIATYPGTAYGLAVAGRLADLNRYLDADDLNKFQPDFLAEGRFSTGGPAGLYILPIAKSSEVVALNLTAWREFTAAYPRYADPAETLATWESVSQAAEAYHNWSGGRSMIGFDSLANFLIAGSRQLGVDLMGAAEGKMVLDLDREALLQIWNIYYNGTVQGGFGAYGRYRADDLATGDLIAGIVSTASGTWLPDRVEKTDGSQLIDLAIFQFPTFRGGEAVCIQQGAGMAVVRSDIDHEAAAAVFLDWLIQPEQNVNFAVKSSYLPVTLQALQSQLMRDSLQLTGTGSASASCLDAFLSQMQTGKLYYPGTFRGSDEIRYYLENSLAETASAARQAWLADQRANIAPGQLQSRYINDAAFETWYSSIMLGIDRILELDSD